MKIALLGDIAVFQDGLLNSDWKQGMKKVANILKKCDLVVANLETPLTNKKNTLTCKGIHLKSSPNVINLLKYLNIRAVCLANNHICDFGKKGMEDTINLLKSNNIDYFGVNNKIFNFKKNENNLIFGGFCCYSTNGTNYINKYTSKGVNTLTRKNIANFLKNINDKNELGVLSLHWGDEYSRYVNEKQVSLMHEFANNYDFILHGHHAHAMQAIEKFRNSLLAYNLGNFCFDDCTSPVNKKIKIKQSKLNKESFILLININGNKIISYDTIGIYYNNNEIKILDNNKILEKLQSKIKDCSNKSYKDESLKMISNQKKQNLSKHNLKWLISKINYYSIGAKLLSYKNKYYYKKSY